MLNDYAVFEDEFSKEPAKSVPLFEGDDDLPIEPISDINISKMNELMFPDLK